MKIYISKCTDPLAWYAKLVGQVVEVEGFEQNLSPKQGIPEDVYWAREGGAYNAINWIRASDAYVLEEGAEQISKMSKLKIKIRTQKVIDEAEWSRFVTEVYGRPYRFQQQDGCQDRGTFPFTVPFDSDDLYDHEEETVQEKVNGSEMGVSFAAWLARNPKKKLPALDEQEDYCLELWWHRNFYPHISMIVNDLYKKGLLEEGKYLINIDW